VKRSTSQRERIEELVCMEDSEISKIIFNRMDIQKRRKHQRAKRAKSAASQQ